MFLDIGCGWGGMALQIAKEYGSKGERVLLLSENQFSDGSTGEHRNEGLSVKKLQFVLQDYRNEKDKYDRIVSVGMFEHVGVDYFSRFFF